MLAGTACGRVSFDATNDAATSSSFLYESVHPVYLVGRDMVPLVPTITTPASAFSISPPLPAGMQLATADGTISGTPTESRTAALHTVVATTAEGSLSAAIRIRTADGFVVNSNGNDGDAVLGDQRCATGAGNDICTLRAAMSEINSLAGPAFVIYIPAQTITLTLALPGAVTSMELIGDGPAATIIDVNNVGPLTFFNAGGVQLRFAGLTIRNAVGSISDNLMANIALGVDTVVVEGCNLFAKLGSTGAVSLLDSVFRNNTGELVYVGGGTTQIDRCTFENNTLNTEGTLYFQFGNGRVNSSTFTGNSGDNAAILINNGNITFANNTIANNTATGAFRAGGVVVYSGGTATFTNNIIANNSGARLNCAFTGTATSNGGNLDYPSDGSCELTNATDVPGADPLLGPLADNGGPTPTMALGAGSPAIDSAVAAECPALDQRLSNRPQGGGCDIGAVEQQ